MAFAGISYMGVLLAAIASWIFGAAYYGVLGGRWAEALGKSRAELMPGGRPPVVPMLISFIAELAMAWVLAGVIGHLGPGNVTVRAGLISGALCWVGFVLTTLATNNAYAQTRRSLTLIDGSHWLGVLLIQGLVIGIIGV